VTLLTTGPSKQHLLFIQTVKRALEQGFKDVSAWHCLPRSTLSALCIKYDLGAENILPKAVQALIGLATGLTAHKLPAELCCIENS
jgi:hypothetical protein